MFAAVQRISYFGMIFFYFSLLGSLAFFLLFVLEPPSIPSASWHSLLLRMPTHLAGCRPQQYQSAYDNRVLSENMKESTMVTSRTNESIPPWRVLLVPSCLLKSAEGSNVSLAAPPIRPVEKEGGERQTSRQQGGRHGKQDAGKCKP